MNDLYAVYADRRGRLVATLAELRLEHRAFVEEILGDCDARLAGDVTRLSDKGDVRRALNRIMSDIVEDVLSRYNMRGHATPGSAQWQDRKADLLRSLFDAKKPTRSARRMVSSAVVFGDALTVEILTSQHSRVLLGSMGIDPRAVAIAAVRALAAQMGSLPGAAFLLLQESDASLAELVTFASFLTPVY